MLWKKITVISGLMLAFSLTIPQAEAQKWSSDDDIPVVTVKKKYFLKSKRHEVGFNGGFLFNDTFVNTIALAGTWGYHFNEMYFVEVSGGFYLNYKSESTKQLEDDFGIIPDTDDIEYFGEVHAGWSPIYGKLNFLQKQIVYFDTSLYFGGGITKAEISDFSPHIVVGLAERIILNKWVALRLDIKDSIIIRDSSGVSGKIRNVVGIHLGLSFFLPVK